jgi:hypothetical protein
LIAGSIQTCPRNILQGVLTSDQNPLKLIAPIAIEGWATLPFYRDRDQPEVQFPRVNLAREEGLQHRQNRPGKRTSRDRCIINPVLNKEALEVVSLDSSRCILYDYWWRTQKVIFCDRVDGVCQIKHVRFRINMTESKYPH